MIAVNLLTFTTPKKNPQNAGDYQACRWYATLREGGTAVREISLCRTDERKTAIYRSTGNTIHLSFYTDADLDTLPYFIIEYAGKLTNI